MSVVHLPLLDVDVLEEDVTVPDDVPEVLDPVLDDDELAWLLLVVDVEDVALPDDEVAPVEDGELSDPVDEWTLLPPPLPPLPLNAMVGKVHAPAATRETPSTTSAATPT